MGTRSVNQKAAMLIGSFQISHELCDTNKLASMKL